jgi:hypothetical protein
VERLLARLERRFGRYAIPNLPKLIAGGMGIAYVGNMARPGLVDMLELDRAAIFAGQPWRLVSWLFVPPDDLFFGFHGGPFMVLFGIYMIWLFGNALEEEWGAFKLNAFFAVGMLGIVLAAMVTGAPMGNGAFNLGIFLAYATLFPDTVFRIMFILPIRAKWLGLLSAAGLAVQLVLGDWGIRFGVLAAFSNYALFFAGHWWDWWKARNLRVRQAARRASGEGVSAPKAGGRRCAICGASEDDGADIRVCNCEKCGGKPRTLCLEHARNH